MARTDLIADTLTIIRNGSRTGKANVDVPASKMIKAILTVFRNKGYIEDFKPLEEVNSLRVYLKFDEQGRPEISGLKRVSKSSLRVYSGRRDIPRVLGGQGTAVISTSKGVLPGREAKKLGLGGEVVCYIW
ncbi:MAG: 30S ribosomal protein S8 [Candidatus Omnitrophota bacterium]